MGCGRQKPGADPSWLPAQWCPLHCPLRPRAQPCFCEREAGGPQASLCTAPCLGFMLYKRGMVLRACPCGCWVRSFVFSRNAWGPLENMDVVLLELQGTGGSRADGAAGPLCSRPRG